MTINEEKCNGSGLGIPNFPEGSLQTIDGKARPISDIFCDGLSACIGHCSQEIDELEEKFISAREAGVSLLDWTEKISTNN